MIEAFLKRLLSVLFLGSSFLALLSPISTGGTMEHFHSYDRSLCACGKVEFQDENDHTVILSSLSDVFISGTTATIPERITRDGETYTVVGLGPALFREQTWLTDVICPDTLRYIGRYCFDGCTSLRHINLPDRVERIELAAFQLCSSLEEIKLPKSLTYLGNFSYNHCSSATNTSIVIPKSLTQIGDDVSAPAHMFYDCGQDHLFTEFVVEEGNPAYKAVDGILYTKDGSTLVSIPRGKTFPDHTYTMLQTVTSLGELSFSRNKDVHTVVLSDSLLVNGYQTLAQRQAFINRGNDLSVACYGYSGVSAYEVRETNPHYQAVDGILYSRDLSRLVAIPMQYAGDITVPEGVKAWGKDALSEDVEYFKGIALNQITGVSLPKTLTVMEDSQIEVLNLLADTYGTILSIDPENPAFTVDGSGHLVRRP